MTRNDMPVDIICIYHDETARAIFVSADGNEDQGVWLPKSQIEYDWHEACEGEQITVTMPFWLGEREWLV